MQMPIKSATISKKENSLFGKKLCTISICKPKIINQKIIQILRILKAKFAKINKTKKANAWFILSQNSPFIATSLEVVAKNSIVIKQAKNANLKTFGLKILTINSID